MSVPPAALPFWARPRGVLLIVGLWCVLHALIGGVLESAVNVDDAIESYFVQSLRLSYVSHDPPLFDWLLFALQQVVGSGRLSFALLRYGLLFACATLIYGVARRTIFDPRLQALSVYSLSALWVMGYHSHRILSHSNVMLVAIAGTMLTLMMLEQRRSARLYAGLGGWIVVGMLGKFGFAAFLGVLVASCLIQPRYRRVLTDRRVLLTVLTAAVPLGLYLAMLPFPMRDLITGVAQTIGDARVDWDDMVRSYVMALVGYALPFVALMGLVFLPGNRGAGARLEADPARDAARHLLRNLILIGLIATLIAVLALETAGLRDRYLHVILLLLPVYAFAELERVGGWRMRVPAYLGLLLALAVGVLLVRLIILLWPDPWLCGRCVAAEPLYRLAPTVRHALGTAPTLVADSPAAAGRLRAAIPQARVVVANDVRNRPPPRPSTGCARITGIATGLPPELLPPPMPETIELPVKWWSPLMNPHRWSDWQFTPLPVDDPLCR